jgi:hypothetical protein
VRARSRRPSGSTVRWAPSSRSSARPPYTCLSNALRLETYIQDADREGDSDAAGLFRKAQADSRKGAEMGKQPLRSRLAS